MASVTGVTKHSLIVTGTFCFSCVYRRYHISRNAWENMRRWWKSKSPCLHFYLLSVLEIISLGCSVFQCFIVNTLREFSQWVENGAAYIFRKPQQFRDSFAKINRTSQNAFAVDVSLQSYHCCNAFKEIFKRNSSPIKRISVSADIQRITREKLHIHQECEYSDMEIASQALSVPSLDLISFFQKLPLLELSACYFYACVFIFITCEYI